MLTDAGLFFKKFEQILLLNVSVYRENNIYLVLIICNTAIVDKFQHLYMTLWALCISPVCESFYIVGSFFCWVVGLFLPDWLESFLD